MSKSYNSGNVPVYIQRRRKCIIQTLRELRDALCETGYTPLTIKNNTRCDRQSIGNVKRMGGHLELDDSLRCNPEK